MKHQFNEATKADLLASSKRVIQSISEVCEDSLDSITNIEAGRGDVKDVAKIVLLINAIGSFKPLICDIASLIVLCSGYDLEAIDTDDDLKNAFKDGAIGLTKKVTAELPLINRAIDEAAMSAKEELANA